MSIVNLQRDALFVAPEKSTINFGSSNSFGEGFFRANTDPVVYDVYAQVRNIRTSTITIANNVSIVNYGCFLKPPGVELTPYRVKAYGIGNDPLIKFAVTIGYAEDTITGSNDEITHYSLLHFDTKFDELIMLQPSVAVDTFPIFFGIQAIGICTAATVNTYLSVQRLATSPPQFSQSVS